MTDRHEFEAAFPQLDHRDYLADGLAAYIDPKTQGAWEGWVARGRRIAAAPEGAQPVMPRGVQEALQRMIEDTFSRGPASVEDGRLVQKWVELIHKPEGAQAVAMYQVRPRLGDGSLGAWREVPKRYFDDYDDNETGYSPDRWERRKLYTAPPSLDAEDAALRVDAERYRWLRDEAHNGVGMSPAVILAEADFPVDDHRTDGFVFGHELDAAIDAARGAGGAR